VKPWLYAFLVFVSLSLVAFGLFSLAIDARRAQAERSYVEAFCYDLNHGLPTPPPLRFDDGTSLAFSCGVPGA
jgi:hypothetical protein